MAAGAGGSSGDSLESTLDRKFQNVSNTMDSIQGLSTWCIDNKKYHSLIVRQWVKCVRKSDAPHRLNLFYLANDVIQNCKRKNAIVYRTAFAEVLRETFTLVNQDSDQKVIKSLERILSIWEERGVYSGTLISELRSSLVKEESPVETPVEQKTPVESNAYLRSKIVAEFVPQALNEQLSKYKRSIEDVDLREKQLAAMRIDICNNETLKKLKDKAGGKKFSKDFEEGSAQLQEFVKFFNSQCKTGPPLLQALSNADIFYEMQYKEVKIVANAYQTFANRVSHLKRKLDALKATLPDLDDSPIPSPSADAPSPTGSESPFHDMELANADPDLDGSVMEDEAEPPAPSPLSSPGGSPRNPDTLWDKDNRMVEDMELSEEEVESAAIIEQRRDASDPVVSTPALSTPAAAVSTPAPTKKEPLAAPKRAVAPAVSEPEPEPESTLDNVDLAKIESILNSLSSAMKKTADSPPAAARPPPSLKTTAHVSSAAPQDTGSLVNLLSKVDMSPADLLSALSKVQGLDSLDGISSLLSNSRANDFSDSAAASTAPPATSSAVPSAVSFQSQPSTAPPAPPSSSPVPPQKTSNPATALVQALHQDMDLTAESEPTVLSESLESKIHNFLQGNSAFSAFDLGFHTPSAPGRDILSPATGVDNQGGTPVRDEGGGTPTQDEIMDKPSAVAAAAAAAPFTSTTNQSTSTLYQNSGQKNPNNPLQPGATPNGKLTQQYLYGQHGVSEQGAAAPVAHFQQVAAPAGAGPVPGDRAPPGGAGGSHAPAWYGGDVYPEGNSQQLGPSYHAAPTRGADKNKAPGPYQYQAEQPQQRQELAAQQGANPSSFAFVGGGLPPVPNLPPPPQQDFENRPHAAGGRLIPQEQPPLRPDADAMSGAGMDSVIRGMVVHDHQHKSMFRPEDEQPDELHYQDESDYYPDEHGYGREEHFFPDHHQPQDQDEAYHGPGSPPRHFPRARGHPPAALPPPDDPYFGQDFQWRGPRPPRFPPRRAPPHLEMRPPRPRPPHRPPFPPQHLPHPPPHPRGLPGPPFAHFQGPDFRMRLKRPDPRGMGPPSGPMFGPKRPFLPPRY
ncbi:regulation of nuclear pre-mRNA domain-containing protein 2a isoform X2 [Nelusetta ayraudi]|uniref:regulation of nuclear pre-mRNA domain-containing protein 2a isoform X2 n=1 Tax=Nelusetta ayraudi TaxID=303726 RepID=UPI003F6EAB59